MPREGKHLRRQDRHAGLLLREMHPPMQGRPLVAALPTPLTTLLSPLAPPSGPVGPELGVGGRNVTRRAHSKPLIPGEYPFP